MPRPPVRLSVVPEVAPPPQEEEVANLPLGLEKEIELKEEELELENAGRVEADQYIKVTRWLMEKPEPSAREIARRLYGKDNGRFTMRAIGIIKRVKSVTAERVTGEEEGPASLKTMP